MIFGYSGKPGAGKSYSVVEHCIIPALKAGRVVYHNMQLQDDRLRALCGDTGELIQFDRDSTAQELVDGAPAGALVVIDESLRYWPSGTRANKVPANELEFFTMHRHRVGADGRATDIVLICQDFGSQCASFIRELIQYTYYSVKLSHLGLSKKYRMEVYEGCVKGDSPPAKKLVRKTVSTYKPAIYACYQSHTMAEKGVAGEEIRDKGASVWRSWQVYSAGIALLVALFCVVHVIQWFHHFGQKPAAKPEHSEGVAAVSTVPVKPPEPKESSRWRYAGFIEIDGQRFQLADGDHGSRILPAESCKADVGGNVLCKVDGEMVASWTGPSASVLTQFVGSSIAGSPSGPF